MPGTPALEQPAPELSIVVPALNEETCLPRLWEEIEAACRDCGCSYEVVFVDDGSTDGTWQAIADLAAANPEVRGLRLSRNFGHQKALIAGLSHSRGEAVVSMDADLQHPPELLAEMVRLWRGGIKIVSTRRDDSAAGQVLKRLTARVFYSLFSALSDVKLDYGKADYRLLDREVVDVILTMPEASLFLRGMVEWVGFSQETIQYAPRQRAAGRTKYSLRRMVGLAISGVTSFSVVPLRASIVIGLITTLLSLGYFTYALVAAMFGAVVRGWTSLICLFSFLFGVQFIIIGVMGEYLAQAFLEIKRRPRFIVADSTGFGSGSPEHDPGQQSPPPGRTSEHA